MINELEKEAGFADPYDVKSSTSITDNDEFKHEGEGHVDTFYDIYQLSSIHYYSNIPNTSHPTPLLCPWLVP